MNSTETDCRRRRTGAGTSAWGWMQRQRASKLQHSALAPPSALQSPGSCNSACVFCHCLLMHRNSRGVSSVSRLTRSIVAQFLTFLHGLDLLWIHLKSWSFASLLPEPVYFLGSVHSCMCSYLYLSCFSKTQFGRSFAVQPSFLLQTLGIKHLQPCPAPCPIQLYLPHCLLLLAFHGLLVTIHHADWSTQLLAR